MDPVSNPFRPGAGRRPPVLAGREPLLAAFETVHRRATEHGEGDRGWILSGLRGVGKTVLLNELLSRVSGQGWVTAKVEARPGTPLPVALSGALVKSLRTSTGRHPESGLRRLLGIFKAFALKVDPTSGAMSLGVEVDPSRGVADTGRFADDLAALFEAMGETSRELGIGTLIVIDELQEATGDELNAINTAVQHVGQAERPSPLMLVGAGLPSLPALLTDATSSAERLYDYRPVGLLGTDASREALAGATREHQVTWEPEAVELAIEVAGGYPYFLQALGRHVWDSAPGPVITTDDVVVGGQLARDEVNEGLYKARWDRATTAQRQLLRAMAELGSGTAVAVSDLPPAVGKRRLQDISQARNELIKKGLVYPPERGMLAFTVPGMHSFVLQQD